MKKLCVFLTSMLFTVGAYANDGGFNSEGNQLIPMNETSISVRKEILTIDRNAKRKNQVDVTVYYEFYNPGPAKTMTVGFEATSPAGNVDNTAPVNGHQPFIHHFTVEMNGKNIPHQVAIVNTKHYYQGGKFNTLTKKQIQDRVDEGSGEYADFMYVYHFQGNFRKGLNIIKHTYTCDLSTFVYSDYTFSYILSAAKRWGNRRIDDFTLNINMGDNQWIDVSKTFFARADEWTITGIGKKMDGTSSTEEREDQPSASFYVKKGYISFNKNNFNPKGELDISLPRNMFTEKTFNYRKQASIYPDAINNTDDCKGVKPANETSMKILRNIPFAKRGYVFSDADVQKYFEKQIWYFPDTTYKPDSTKLSYQEQKWIQSCNK